jgi:hypothetical protein
MCSGGLAAELEATGVHRSAGDGQQDANIYIIWSFHISFAINQKGKV